MMQTIYTLKIECVGGAHLKQRFLRVAEVPADLTLGALRGYVRELAGFTEDHRSTFYTANSLAGRVVWLTATGEWNEEHAAAGGPLWAIPLHRVFPLPKHKQLYFRFDFGANWMFAIRKQGKAGLPRAGVKYPRVIRKLGPKPEQYPANDQSSEIQAAPAPRLRKRPAAAAQTARSGLRTGGQHGQRLGRPRAGNHGRAGHPPPRFAAGEVMIAKPPVSRTRTERLYD